MLKNQFQKKSRLLNQHEFKTVFSGAKKAGDRFFTILFKENGLEHSRLGVIVAKKNSKKAVERNRIKRLIRESYRHQQYLQAVDIVVLSRRDTGKQSNQALYTALGRLWQQLEQPQKSTN